MAAMSSDPYPTAELAAGAAALPTGADRVAGFGETVFATYTRLAREHEAVNLGQGFPDFAPPAFVLEALREASTGPQQYAPLAGMPELLEQVVIDEASRSDRDLDPVGNVQVTVGATEGLFAAMQAFVNPGDEVVLLEPYYDAYAADVVMAGGTPRVVPLELDADGRWCLDPRRLQAALSSSTRMIVVNSPHNPTGKAFEVAELDAIVAAAAEVGALILSDEVYEHISFAPHVPMASRPGAWERTLTLHSFGKSFSVTGWKVGWAVGPEALVKTLRMAHQWIPFTVATPLQVAAARALEVARGSGYYEQLRDAFRRRRDLLLSALRPTPFEALTPDGGYFVVADGHALGYEDDVALCLDLPRRVGVVGIPTSAFYSRSGAAASGRPLVRFAYCKEDAAIEEAGRRLAGLA